MNFRKPTALDELLETVEKEKQAFFSGKPGHRAQLELDSQAKAISSFRAWTTAETPASYSLQ